jgi:hypothetical protein
MVMMSIAVATVLLVACLLLPLLCLPLQLLWKIAAR